MFSAGVPAEKSVFMNDCYFKVTLFHITSTLLTGWHVTLVENCIDKHVKIMEILGANLNQ